MVRRLEDGRADVVVGSRHVSGGHIAGWSWRRRATSKVATVLARSLVPAARDLADPMSGFFGVDREVVTDDVLEAADPHGYKILLELLQRVPDAAVSEYPIEFRERADGESKLTLDEQLRFLEHVASLRLLSIGLEERLRPPLVIRSVEFGLSFAACLTLLYAGLILGDVDGAGGAALIAAAGGGLVLSIARLRRTGDRWQDSQEAYSQ